MSKPETLKLTDINKDLDNLWVLMEGAVKERKIIKIAILMIELKKINEWLKEYDTVTFITEDGKKLRPLKMEATII